MIIGNGVGKDGENDPSALIIGLTYRDCVALIEGRTVTQTLPEGVAAIAAVLVLAEKDNAALLAKLCEAFKASGKEVELVRIDENGKTEAPDAEVPR